MKMNWLENVNAWLSGNFDAETKTEIENLKERDQLQLEDAFYRSLEFGTGGLRGVMGVGTNRINKYTIGMATQGFANYIRYNFVSKENLSVAIAFDSRNNSKYFAGITASVFVANGFKVYLFDDIRPVPELSFAIRNLNCQAGVMITASHNPKEYNGYKAYWEDGAQITAPHDTNVINEVNKISDPSMVKFEGGNGEIIPLGEDMDNKYLSSILSLFLSPESIKNHSDLKIVYSALHGTGVKMVPEALRRLGFRNIISQPEQSIPDGNFPTVDSPNPEETSALAMSMELANKENADIVMATDPDADRVGVAVRNHEGNLVILNGNQTAAILTYYLLRRWSDLGKLTPNSYMVKTIVTTELLSRIAEGFGVEMYNVLTGFKYIAEIVRKNEGNKIFIGGGEESYGFNVGEFVRDKDAVISCCFVAEAAAWARDNDLSLYQLLDKIYKEFGYYKESLISLTKKGKEGVEQIAEMMKMYRDNPPTKLFDSPVNKVVDYNMPELTNLPKSNVLQFFSEDGSVVSMRPSGTEPKIKFYFGVKGTDVESLDYKLGKLKDQFAGGN